MAQEYWFHHVGLSVTDFEGSIEWYARILGFKCEGRFHNPNIPADMAMLRNGDMHVELLSVPNSAPVPPERKIPNKDLKTCGNKHICFGCAYVPAVVDDIRARGGDVVWMKDNGPGASMPSSATMKAISSNSCNARELPTVRHGCGTCKPTRRPDTS